MESVLGTTTVAAVCGNCSCPNGQGPLECPQNDVQRYIDSCVSCDAGFHLVGDECISCGDNEFQEINGFTGDICQPKTICPDGQYDVGDASVDSICEDCSECGPGFFQSACSNNHDSVCSECVAGQYSALNDTTSCEDCPIGRFEHETGSTECKECGLGTFQDEEGGLECKNCPEGTAGTQLGLNASDECQMCVPGTFAETEGLSECEDCEAGKYGVKQGSNSSSDCEACPSGQFQDEPASTECKQCPGDSAADGRSCLGVCQKGHYKDVYHVCKPCPQGEYQPNFNFSGLTCLMCPVTSSSGEGASSCNFCDPGYGFNGTGANGHSTCELCTNEDDPPTYNNKADGSACGLVEPCGPGLGYKPSPIFGSNFNGTDDCVPCTNGTYSDTTDFQQCQAHRVCVGQNTMRNGTAALNTLCGQLIMCGAGEYMSGRDNLYNPICNNITTCQPGQFVVADPTDDQDRQCQTCSGSYSIQENAQQCTTWTAACDTNTQYESITPTVTQDRECLSLTGCNSTQYVSVEKTLTSDAQCESLSICNPGQYVNVSAQLNQDRTCAPCVNGYSAEKNSAVCTSWTICGDQIDNTTRLVSNTHTSPGTCAQCTAGFALTDSDNCQAHTVCNNNQYRSNELTPTTDAICTALTVCDSDAQFESLASNATRDRQCQSLTNCSTTQFINVNKTATSDRECKALTNCDAGQYVLISAQPTQDRTCAPCVDGYSTEQNSATCKPWLEGGEQENGDPRLTDNSSTSPGTVQPCTIGTFALTDKDDCEAHSTCTSGTNYQIRPPNTTHDTLCVQVSLCEDDHYETSAPDMYTDRQCAPHGSCGHQQYIVVPGTEYAAVQCSPWTTCGPGTYVSAQPNGTHNRECSSCTIGYTDQNNEDVCSPWTACGLQNNWDPRLQLHTNKAPGSCAECSAGTWAALDIDDCHGHTQCDLGVTYQTRPPSSTQDRICNTTTNCVLGQTFQVVSATLVRNRVCNNVRNCQKGTYISKDPTLTSNRECVACTNGYTDQTNLQFCKPWTTCGSDGNNNRREGHTATSTGQCKQCSAGRWAVSDTDNCQTWKDCTAEQYQVTTFFPTPSLTRDRVCTNAKKMHGR